MMASIVVSSHYISDGNDLLDLPMGRGGLSLTCWWLPTGEGENDCRLFANLDY